MATVGQRLDEESRSLRVATWNVHEGLPRGRHDRGANSGADVGRFDEIVSLLNEQAVDVVALQELDVDEDGTSMVMEAIRTRTALNFGALEPLSPSPFGNRHQAGIGIAGRFPLTDVRCGTLPNPQESMRDDLGSQELFDKGWISAALRVASGELAFMSIHAFPFHRFGTSAEDPRFVEVWARLASEIDDPSQEAFIAAGDFNTPDRGLILERSQRPLASTFSGIPTHNGKPVDDILISTSLQPSSAPVALDNFSDHQLCIVDIVVGLDG